jgi:hypothetical protein
MRRSFDSTRGAIATAVCTIFIASFAALNAQQPKPAPAPAAAAAAPAQKPLVPLATNTIATNPDAYYGEGVTIMAAVGDVISKTAFSVDQKRVAQTAGKAPKGPTDVLVIAPTMNGMVTHDSYVTVVGELMKFDPAAIAKKAKDYKLDLPPDAIAKYTGRPVLLATAVIDEKFVDVAKKPLPPMTADDLALSKVMKQVGPAFTALRTGIDAANSDAATKNVAVLKQNFADTETFWKGKSKADAIEWAADARKQVDLIDHAVAAGKWDDAKAPAAALATKCASCHGAYRERLDDGTFRIKLAPK